MRRAIGMWALAMLATVACGGGGTSTATQSSPTPQSTPTSPVAASGEYTVIVWSPAMTSMGPFNTEFDARYTQMKSEVTGVFQARLLINLACHAADANGRCTDFREAGGKVQAAGMFFLLHGSTQDVIKVYRDAKPGGLLAGEELHAGLCHFVNAPQVQGNAPESKDIPDYAKPYNCPGRVLPPPT